MCATKQNSIKLTIITIRNTISYSTNYFFILDKKKKLIRDSLNSNTSNELSSFLTDDNKGRFNNNNDIGFVNIFDYYSIFYFIILMFFFKSFMHNQINLLIKKSIYHYELTINNDQ